MIVYNLLNESNHRTVPINDCCLCINPIHNFKKESCEGPVNATLFIAMPLHPLDFTIKLYVVQPRAHRLSMGANTLSITEEHKAVMRKMMNEGGSLGLQLPTPSSCGCHAVYIKVYMAYRE